MTNTLKITLIAAVSLLTTHLSAAQFIMQVKSPDGITVVEGDKGSETPVVPEAGEQTPTNNFIEVISTHATFYKNLSGNKIGYHADSNCSYDRTQEEQNGWTYWTHSSTNYFLTVGHDIQNMSANSFIDNMRAIINGKQYGSQSLLNNASQFWEVGTYGLIGHRVIDNTLVFFTDDNSNGNFDNGETEFYVGEFTKNGDMFEEGDELINYYNVCIKQ